MAEGSKVRLAKIRERLAAINETAIWGDNKKARAMAKKWVKIKYGLERPPVAKTKKSINKIAGASPRRTIVVLTGCLSRKRINLAEIKVRRIRTARIFISSVREVSVISAKNESDPKKRK